MTEQVPGLHTACVTEPTRPRSVDSATNLPPVQTQWRGTRREWQAISESTPAFKWFLIASRSWEAPEETSQQAQSHFTFRHNMNPACALIPVLNVFIHVRMTRGLGVSTMDDDGQLHTHISCYLSHERLNQTSLPLRPDTPPVSSSASTCALPPTLSSLPLRLLHRVACFSLPVPIQLVEQQHGEPGEPRHLSQPLQLRERLLVRRAHPLALLPAQLHLRGPVAGPGHPLQHRLPRTAHLPGVLPAVQHRQVCNMDRE